MANRLVGVALAHTVLLVGCSHNGEESPEERLIQVSDGGDKDFGHVKYDGQTLSHTFVLTNRGNVPLTIDGVRRSCGCLETKIDNWTLEPGGVGHVTMELQTNLFWGKRDAVTILNFKPTNSMISLKVSAYVDRDYKVTVLPLHWVVPKGTPRGAIIEKQFKVREFNTSDSPNSDVTEIIPASHSVRVKKVDAWKDAGSSKDGIGRETNVTLEMTTEFETPGDVELKLEFRHAEGISPRSSNESIVVGVWCRYL